MAASDGVSIPDRVFFIKTDRKYTDGNAINEGQYICTVTKEYIDSLNTKKIVHAFDEFKLSALPGGLKSVANFNELIFDRIKYKFDLKWHHNT